MAMLQDVTAAEQVFTGTDHVLQHTVYDDATTPAVVNITGWALQWVLYRKGGRPPLNALITKTVGSGIAITNGAGGILQVTVANTNWDNIPGSVSAYAYELRRTDAGSETVLAYGDFVLLQSPVA